MQIDEKRFLALLEMTKSFILQNAISFESREEIYGQSINE